MVRKNKENIGFIGLGVMGLGMAKNLMKAKRRLHIVANQNRKPVEQLKSAGAVEVATIGEMTGNCQTIILCLPNASISSKIILSMLRELEPDSLIIDCTTIDPKTANSNAIACKEANIRYAGASLAGGQQQSHDGMLGAIIGCPKADFDAVNTILTPCCDVIEYFGDAVAAARTKLISNFLALSTATLVVETMKVAREFNIDWEKFYKVASRGSGNSMSLQRIVPKAIEKDYSGYVFSISHAVKDFEYIADFLKHSEDASAISQLLLSIYLKALNADTGQKNISERLDPDF